MFKTKSLRIALCLEVQKKLGKFSLEKHAFFFKP